MIYTALELDRVILMDNPNPPFQQYSYEYCVRSGAMTELAEKLRRLDTDLFVVITDRGVPAAPLQEIQTLLAETAPVFCQFVEKGELDKGLPTIERMGDEAIRAGATRASVVVAVGGGLVGNIAGLLAALLYRGSVRLVQVPTTFLAMSDSCLSLKQGVNSVYGKNHYGQFKAPYMVWCDLGFLRSLPRSEIRSALCELIKNVLAICPEQYEAIAAQLRIDAVYSEAQLLRFLAFCLDAKCAILRLDAHETQDALRLEYGHTAGHAGERASHRENEFLPHGIAVGHGMRVAATIAYQIGLLSKVDVQAHETLLRLNGVAATFPSYLHPGELLTVMRLDNKRGYLLPQSGAIAMVLLEQLGVPHKTNGTVLTQVDENVVRRVLEMYCA